MKILKARESHIPAILEMLREFAEFEKLDEFFEVTEERLSAALFGATKVAEALVAMDGDTFAGYAIFFPSFASFRGQRGFYLEDIYIRKEFRGQGLGEKILSEIASIARKRGCERIDFTVLDWNGPAVRFYKKLGAVHDADDLHFKFTDEAFEAL